MTESMLTTIDNPYDPFEQYEEWFAYDSRQGYHTPNLLARIAFVSDETSDFNQKLTLEQAIDEIVFENVNGLYKKVSR